jgi:hypothetical protein
MTKYVDENIEDVTQYFYQNEGKVYLYTHFRDAQWGTYKQIRNKLLKLERAKSHKI